jgi:hypothetical protein
MFVFVDGEQFNDIRMKNLALRAGFLNEPFFVPVVAHRYQWIDIPRTP